MTYKDNQSKGKFPKYLEISKMLIFDWYDGILQALIKFEGFDYWIYANLIAWDMKNKTKFYHLVPLNKLESKRILDILKPQEPKWPIWNPQILTEEQSNKMKKYIKSLLKENSKKNKLLIQTNNIGDNEHEVINADNLKIPFYENIDQVMNQDDYVITNYYKLFNDSKNNNSN